MKDLMVKVYTEKMVNGNFEKIISDKLDEAVKKTFDDMFSYNGAVRTELKAKLQQIMSSVIESSDFGAYVEKIKLIIDESVKGSNLEAYKKTMEELSNIIGIPAYDFNSQVKISEMFKKYCKFVQDDLAINSYDDYCDESEIEEGQVSAAFSISVDVEENAGFFGDKDVTVVFKTTRDDNDEALEDYTYAFKLWKVGDNYKIHFSHETDKNILRLNDFELEIIRLKNASAKIELDVTNDVTTESIYWDYEY